MTRQTKVKRIHYYIYTLVAIISFTIVGCTSEHTKLMRSHNYDAKFKAAVEAYEQKDYYRANQLFEDLQLYYRGKDKAEDVNMYYGKSLMEDKQYYAAGYQFETFVRWFPYSPKSEEALFYSAYCKYMVSPEFYLDQSFTHESIKAFQSFVDRYPNSSKVPQANKYLDELRLKLIQKDYTNAYNYYKIGYYQAARMTLNEFINKYSDQTLYRQEAMYYVVLADYYFAIGSVADRQKDRFNTMILDYQRYEALFANMTDQIKKQDLEQKYQYALKIVNDKNIDKK